VRRRPAPLVLALLAALVAGPAACGSCNEAPTGAGPEAGAPDPPVPVPAGIVAEGVVVTPDASWGRVHKGVGGLLTLLSPTVGGLLANALAADGALGAEIDGNAPAHAVLGDVGGSPALVLAIRARSSARVRTLLLDGDRAPYRAAGDHEGLAILESARPGGPAVGVSRTHVVVAPGRDALVRFGPYAYRTLPTQPLPPQAVHIHLTQKAAELARRELGARWGSLKSTLLERDAEQRKAHGGREPDFGDASAIVALLDGWVLGKIGAVGDTQGGEASLDVGDDDVRAVATLEPGQGASKEWLDAMRPGDAGPLGDVPADALGAVLVRDDLAGRRETARALSQGAARVLGRRLGDADAKRLEEAALAWANARGDWLTVAATPRGVEVRAPVTDGPLAASALGDLALLAGRPGLREPLGALFGIRSVSISQTEFGGVKGTEVRFVREKDLAPAGAAWVVAGGEIRAAVGREATLALSPQAPAARLSQTVEVGRELAAADGTVGFFLAVRPSGRERVPALASAGRKDGKLVLRASVPDVALRELLRILAGL
jgi:hypothetical protein